MFYLWIKIFTNCFERLVPVWVLMKNQLIASVFLFFFSRAFLWLLAFPVGLMHCSRDPQTSFFNKIFIKNGFTALFIYLKIILLQCFQFLAK